MSYLKSKYGYHECSECGERYTNAEYHASYSLRQIISGGAVRCRRCGANFAEKPKRCYYSDYYSDSNACTECINLNGQDICGQQITNRRKELSEWGYYYTCRYYKPKEPQQLTFWEV